ncbi:MAG: hypothetical protein HKN85_02150 [Gammaproteobacteria bacterium]|nr:hypothetical protein [Gammaproteobacteria bacterium]
MSFNPVILVLGLCPFLASAQVNGVDYQWEEKKKDNGITIYTSPVEGSPFKAVRGEMVITGTVVSLVALVEDMPACPDWAALCRESRVEKRISETESYAYIYNDLPFPVSDRDVYTHVVWTIEPGSGKVSMTSIATEGGTPATKAVRLENAMSQWHFTPNGDGTVLVENFAHIDPNGPTPAWITNLMLVDSPYTSMQNMRKIIEGGGYADAEVPFLD